MLNSNQLMAVCRVTFRRSKRPERQYVVSLSLCLFAFYILFSATFDYVQKCWDLEYDIIVFDLLNTLNVHGK